jgi:hypothetical protein
MAAAASTVVALWPAAAASQPAAAAMTAAGEANAGPAQAGGGQALASQAQVLKATSALRQQQSALRAAQHAAAERARARKRAAERAARSAAEAAQSAQQSQTAPAAPAPAEPSGSAQQIALGMLGSYGWSSSQFSCLISLWNQESGWNVDATNPASGAYGIPQALPGSKMASAGPGWQTDAATQIRWGLGYIRSTYGSPCGAWDHEEADGWY